MLDVKIDLSERFPQMTLQGRFDGVGASVFDDAVAHLPDGLGGTVLLDMEGVDYLSSAGVRSLMRVGKSVARCQGRVWLIAMQPPVRQVFAMAGLLAQFDVVASRREATVRLHAEVAARAHETAVSLKGRTLMLTPIPNGISLLEQWPATGALTCLALDELGVAIGRAGLGNTLAQAAEAVDAFVSTGQMVCVRPTTTENAPPDFTVSDQPEDVPVYVAEAWRLSGTPAAMVVSDDGESSLDDVMDGLPELLKTATEQQGTACIAWILAAMEADGGGEQGWVGMGLQGADGIRRMEAVGLDTLDVKSGTADPKAFLQNALRTESLSGAFSPIGKRRVGRYRAWLFAPALQPAAGRRCNIVFEDVEDPPEEWDWIARRIYADAGEVRLRRLQGGFSAATFHVQSVDREGRRLLPTVLKLADPAFSEREARAYDLYVSKYILNNSAVRMGRCARNGWVGLRYNFLGITGPESRLSWIGEHLVNRPADESQPLFLELFQKILAPWYGQTRPCALRPYTEHDPRGLFQGLAAEALTLLGISPDQPFIHCPPLGRDLPNPYFLLEHVYPARATAEWPGLSSIVHGDLNFNNVLLDEKENIYVIDFSETHMGDVCGDFARMEPIMLLQMTRLRDDDDLTKLLQYLQESVRPGQLFDPPYHYTGDDPFMPKAHALVRLLRAEVRRLAGDLPYTVPYLLGLLRWFLPIVVFRQFPLLCKQASCYASALLAEALLDADPDALPYFGLRNTMNTVNQRPSAGHGTNRCLHGKGGGRTATGICHPPDPGGAGNQYHQVRV